jgi:hypothetical protein
MAGILSKPSVPTPPPVDLKATRRKEEEERRRIAGGQGRRSTVLTPLQGQFDNRKTLLGQ